MAEVEPAARMLGMVAALRQGRPEDVLRDAPSTLEAVADEPLLTARVHAWLAQAHLATGDLVEASRAARAAITAAKAGGDTAGVEQLRGLLGQITLARQAAATQANEPPPLPDTPVARASAALDAGRNDEGEALALTARAAAQADGDAREEVLALLALARVPHRTREALLAARDVADDSDDMNLVTAVAHAADAAGLPFPPKVF